MKNQSKIGVIAIAAAIIAASPAASQTKLIRLSHGTQPNANSEIHVAAEVFEREIAAKSGTLQVRIFPASALGQEREVYEAMQLGSGATCAISGTAILNNFAKRVGVIDLPFLWRDYDHVHKSLDGNVGAQLAKELADVGFVVVAWMDSWGHRNVVTTNREVKGPDDLKGLKIRTIQSPVYIAALRAMGANATPMAFGEVYTSLQTGVLDGMEHGASAIVSTKVFEVTKHMVLTRHLYGPLAFVCSKRAWDGYTGQERSAILAAAAAGRDYQRSLAVAKENEAFDFLKNKGMTIREIDTNAFRERAGALQDEMAQGLGASDLLKLIRETK
jgi:tripartite ATP-independent transporter DctP family solute receptor